MRSRVAVLKTSTETVLNDYWRLLHLANYEEYLSKAKHNALKINVSCTNSTCISYALYTISGNTIQKFGTANFNNTILLVLFGIFRYLYLIHQKDEEGNPESIILYL